MSAPDTMIEKLKQFFHPYKDDAWIEVPAFPAQIMMENNERENISKSRSMAMTIDGVAYLVEIGYSDRKQIVMFSIREQMPRQPGDIWETDE
jgi:hypothetical protein